MAKKTLVFGVGINDADYVVKIHQALPRVGGKQRNKLVWICPFYSVWYSVLRRCRSKRYKAKFPTYLDCTLDEAWLKFSNFKAWMGQQDWEGKELDKDLVVQGNKHYGPDTCIFVSKQVNYVLLDNASKRGDYPLGVSWSKESKKFKAACSIRGKSTFLGSASSEVVAHHLWQKAKAEVIREVAETQDDTRVKEALMVRVRQLEDDLLNNRITVKL